MNLTLKRFRTDESATLGMLFVDGVFECFTLEDTYREEKIQGETRIPPGTYKIKFREVLSGKTKRYRERYPWFKWHLELQDVPNYKYVYIHIGNTHYDTEGCILVGNTAHKTGSYGCEIGRSRDAFQALYSKVSKALHSNEKVTIFIKENP